MKTIKRNLYFLLSAFIIISCSSQEYTTAKLAIQQQDLSKAQEWLPKAMAVEPDNPEIPIVMGVEIHAQNVASVLISKKKHTSYPFLIIF